MKSSKPAIGFANLTALSSQVFRYQLNLSSVQGSAVLL